MTTATKRVMLFVCVSASLVALSFLQGRQWACKPSFLELSSQEISVDAGAVQFGLRVALIGCSRDLHTIQAAEMETARSVISSAVKEFGWRFLNASQDQDLRDLMVDRVNQQLNRKVVTDILVYSFSFSE